LDKVVHFEIPADDLARAQKFYKNLFGWSFNEVPGMDYHMVSTVGVDKNNVPKEPGAINGGMMKRNSPNESSVIVVNVSSIDEYLKKAVSLGGKIALPKMDIGQFGFYARISDTEGNIIGIWQNK